MNNEHFFEEHPSLKSKFKANLNCDCNSVFCQCEIHETQIDKQKLEEIISELDYFGDINTNKLKKKLNIKVD